MSLPSQYGSTLVVTTHLQEGAGLFALLLAGILVLHCPLGRQAASEPTVLSLSGRAGLGSQPISVAGQPPALMDGWTETANSSGAGALGGSMQQGAGEIDTQRVCWCDDETNSKGPARDGPFSGR